MRIKRLILTISTAGFSSMLAAETTYYPTLPGSNIRDYSRPGYVQQGKDIYPTLPGTNIRDYSEPGLTRQGDTIYQTLPGTNIRDFSEPGFKIESNENDE